MQRFLTLDLIVMVILSVLVMFLKLWAGAACLVIVALIAVYHNRVSVEQTSKKLVEIKSEAAEENDEITRSFVDACPVHMCICDINGNVSWSNEGFRRFITQDYSLSEILSTTQLSKLFDEEFCEISVTAGDESYRVTASSRDESGHSKRMLYFENTSASEKLHESLMEVRPCMAYIGVDNYEELLAANPIEDQSKIIADIEGTLHEWSAEVSGCLLKMRSSQYIMLFGQSHLEGMRNDKFSVMEKIHAIKTEADFPTTISVGIGCDAESFTKLQDDAYDAMDLALGRGGDQVVIKDSDGQNEYFGGSLGGVDRRNKGKARIMSHALTRLIKDSDQVLVMGHQHGDLDSIGSSIGIASLAMAIGKKAYIVLNEAEEAIDLIYQAALDTKRFEFVGSANALEISTRDTLLIVVDTHIGPRTECPELLDKCKKIVVIDHHRKAANAIENTVMTYMEPYASSASELVTEIMQYAESECEFENFEMDALLAGITLDTKNFTQNTGVRTFESAGWLKRNGADMKNVSSFNKMRLDFFQKKVNMIASTQIIGDGIAVAYTKEADPSMMMLTGQTADEILHMRGVRASFVAGSLGNQSTVSARSDGSINVQVIMEKLGGGGHINVAAAQSEKSPELLIQDIVQLLREEEIIS